MKKFITAMVLLLVGSTGVMSVEANDSSKEEVKVWVCTGPHSKRYHNNEECRGLQKCSAEIELISIEEAKKRGYTKCKICYN